MTAFPLQYTGTMRVSGASASVEPAPCIDLMLVGPGDGTPMAIVERDADGCIERVIAYTSGGAEPTRAEVEKMLVALRGMRK